MSAAILKYQVKVRTACRMTLFRYGCIRQVTESCGGQCAQGYVAWAALTETNKQTNDIPTNYPTILHIVWIPSFIPVFLSQMNPANFLPATHHPPFTTTPTHSRVAQAVQTSIRQSTRTVQSAAPTPACTSRCNCNILFAKGSAGSCYRRTDVWGVMEMTGLCVRCVAECCGAASWQDTAPRDVTHGPLHTGLTSGEVGV